MRGMTGLVAERTTASIVGVASDGTGSSLAEDVDCSTVLLSLFCKVYKTI
jgi:hypothetical protein